MQYRSIDDMMAEGRLLYRQALAERDTSEQQFRVLASRAEYVFNEVLNRANSADAVFCLGLLYMDYGFHALGIMLLHAVTEAHPEFAPGWGALGVALKKEQHESQAVAAFERAEALMLDESARASRVDIIANLAGCYINTGDPGTALRHTDRGLALSPAHAALRWHKALALLELQRWGEAWPLHEARMDGEAGCTFKHRTYPGDPPYWDGKSAGLIAVHGEQGLGDEIMFASCLPDAFAVPGTQWVIEPNPRLQGLFARSFQQARVVGTHKRDGSDSLRDGERFDFKIALGSLPKFFRRAEPFPGKPYLVADPVRQETYRQKLAALPNRPNIGITWQGGARTTRVDLRSVMLGDVWLPLLRQDVNWISLQYSRLAADECLAFEDKSGIKIHHWPEAATGGDDMDDQAALVAGLDMCVMVCQTGVHVAGALGVPTLVLTPSGPSWRYGVTGNMPWYDSVSLRRRVKGEPWSEVIERVAAEVDAVLAKHREAA